MKTSQSTHRRKDKVPFWKGVTSGRILQETRSWRVNSLRTKDSLQIVQTYLYNSRGLVLCSVMWICTPHPHPPRPSHAKKDTLQPYKKFKVTHLQLCFSRSFLIFLYSDLSMEPFVDPFYGTWNTPLRLRHDTRYSSVTSKKYDFLVGQKEQDEVDPT